MGWISIANLESFKKYSYMLFLCILHEVFHKETLDPIRRSLFLDMIWKQSGDPFIRHFWVSFLKVKSLNQYIGFGKYFVDFFYCRICALISRDTIMQKCATFFGKIYEDICYLLDRGCWNLWCHHLKRI